MLKAVIFDMDGVLIDSEPLHAKAAVLTFQTLGVELPISVCYEYVGCTNSYFYGDLKRRYGINMELAKLLKLAACTKEHLVRTEGYPAIPHVCNLVRDLRRNKIPIAIASSSTLEEIRDNMTAIGIADDFDLFVSGTEVAHSKPFPDIFLKAAQKLGVEPEDTLIIEDSSFGVQAAKAAGAACVGFLNPNSGKQDLHLADIIVEGFEEIDTLFLTQVWERFRNYPLTLTKTERILLRELCMEDFDAHYKLLLHPQIEAALLTPVGSHSDEQEKLQAYIDTMYRFYGYGLWGIFERSGNRLIGRCGLQPFSMNGTIYTEIGYYIDPEVQKRGYAYEAASQTLRLAKERYDLSRIYARIRPENTASLALIHKLGFQREGMFEDHLLYYIDL